jgi:type I restriction enzyme, S subunit
LSVLPTGWSIAGVAQLIAVDGLFSDGDWIESKDQDSNGAIRLLQLADIGDGVFIDKSNRFINEEQFDRLSCTEVFEGDILVARMPDPLGRACIAPRLNQRCVTVVDVAILRPGKLSVNSKWLMYFLNAPSIRQEIELKSSGTTRRRIARGKLAEMQLPVSPRNEQKRIADKLDAILSRVDACLQRLDRVPVILKRFRQAVLAAATSGVLTRDEGYMQIAQSVASLQEVLVSIKTGPFGSSLHKSDYIKNGTPVINPMHIVKGKIIPSADTSVSEETLSKLSGFSLSEGDVLIGRRGEMGRCAVVTQKEHGWLCGTGSMILKPVNNLDPNYLQLVLSSRKTVKTLEARSVGSTMVNLNQKILLKLKIYYPPLIDQKKIVRRVVSLFGYADRIEARYTTARAQVDKLIPATLAKAFRGELVPQDPNDEPASVLLERICTQRNKSAANKSKHSRKVAV